MSVYRKCNSCKEVKERDTNFNNSDLDCDACQSSPKCQPHSGCIPEYETKDGCADVVHKSALPELPLLQGVDLTKLSNAEISKSARESCRQALDELGGMAHLKEYRDRMAAVLEKLSQAEHVTQHHGWTSFDLHAFLSALTCDEMRQPGVEALQQLQRDTGCTVAIAQPKGHERSAVKADVKYGGDLLKLVDVNRATVSCSTTEELITTVEGVVSTWWCTAFRHIVELQDHYFESPLEHGYRQILMVVNFGGILWEVGFSTSPFLRAKEDTGYWVDAILQHVKELVLYYCMRNDDAHLNQLLDYIGIAEVIDVNSAHDKWGRTALHYAAFYGNQVLVDTLLQHKADVWAKDDKNQLPVQHAAVRHCWTAAAAIIDRMGKCHSKLTDDDLYVLRTSLLISAEYSAWDKRQQLCSQLLMYSKINGDSGLEFLFEPPGPYLACLHSLMGPSARVVLKDKSLSYQASLNLAMFVQSSHVIAHLDLQGSNIGVEGVNALAKGLQNNSVLTYLNLGGNNVDDEQAGNLAKMLETNTTLEFLGLEGNTIGSEGASALADALETNSALKTLNLAGNSIGADGAMFVAKALESNSSLETLNLDGNGIGAEGATSLASALENNSALTAISLAENDLGAEGASAFAQMLQTNSTLASIHLGGNNIGAEGTSALATALENNSSLRSISLGENDLCAEGATALAKSLETNSSLKSISIEGNYIQAEGAIAFAQVLQTSCNLTSINLSGNSVGAEGAIAFAKVLATNSSLTSVGLADNDLGVEGIAAVVEALRTNSCLVSLNVEGNNMGSEGANSLADVLATHRNLEDINVGDNGIGAEGCAAFANALKTNSNIKTVSLKWNGIQNEGVGALAATLKTNTTLTSIDLANNDIDCQGGRDLADALRSNSSLTSMNLAGNEGISASTEEEIRQALKRNAASTKTPSGTQADAHDPKEATVDTCSAELYSIGLGILGEEMHSLTNTCRINLLRRKVPPQPNAVVQHHGYSAFGMPAFLKDVSSETMRKAGIEQLQWLSKNTNCEVNIAPPKGLQRSQVKVDVNYGGDKLKLVDINRASVTCNTIEDLVTCLEAAICNWSNAVSRTVELIDHLYSPDSNGLRYVQLVVNFVGTLWEVYFTSDQLKAASKDPEKQAGQTPKKTKELILYYCMQNDAESLLELLNGPGIGDQKVDVNELKDKWGRTALHHAAFHGSQILVDLLLKAGANVLALDESNQLPVQHAAMGRCWPVATALVDRTVEAYTNLEDEDAKKVRPSLLMTADFLANYNQQAPLQALSKCIVGKEMDWSSIFKSTLLYAQCLSAIFSILSTLNLRGYKMGIRGARAVAEALKSNTTVRNLDLGRNDLDDLAAAEISTALSTNTTIKSLDIAGNTFEGPGAASIAEALVANNTLTFINLGGNWIGAEGAASVATLLKSNTVLTSMGIAVAGLCAEGTNFIAGALQTNTTLTSLDIADNHIGAKGAASLAESLKVNTVLSSIDMADNYIGPEGVVALADGLQGNSSLTFMDLANNNIGPKGAAALAGLLRVTSALKVINLADNKVGTAGGIALADALQVNCTLVSIDLANNQIGADGTVALASAVTLNSVLTTLSLRFNQISAKGAISIATALEGNRSLKSIDLSGNKIEADGASALSKALQTNTTLTNMDVSYHCVPEEIRNALETALKQNASRTDSKASD